MKLTDNRVKKATKLEDLKETGQQLNRKQRRFLAAATKKIEEKE